MTPPPHAAVVLAAGGSTRLGRPKQLLRREGEALVHRVARLARATCPSQLLVVVGSHADAVADACADLDVRFVHNPAWRTGLAASLLCAAQHLRDHAGPWLVLGCDQPALEWHHLDALLSGARRSTSGCAAVRHTDPLGNDLLGIPAVVSAQQWQHVAALAGDRGFGATLRAMPPGAVWALDARELAFDIDTPEEEQAAVVRGLLDAL